MPRVFGCRCLEDGAATGTISAHTPSPKEHEGKFYATLGLQDASVRPFCVAKELLVCNFTSTALVPSETRHHHDAWYLRGDPPPPRVAWIITGNLRTFFAPLVHESLLRNGIRAAGGVPSVFFSAAADDESKPGMLSHNAAAPSNKPHRASSTCTTRYSNLSHFLSLHPEWSAITADVSSYAEARPPRDELENPLCTLKEIGWSMHTRDLAQLYRWREAYLAALRYERATLPAELRFAFFARLRFDIAIASPLPSDLLHSHHTAHLSWPCWFKPRARLLPMPDHFFVVPRSHAAAAFDIFGRYRRCRGDSFERSLRLGNPASLESSNATLKDGPPLCCGIGPTGLLVRSLQLSSVSRSRSIGSTVGAPLAPPLGSLQARTAHAHPPAAGLGDSGALRSLRDVNVPSNAREDTSGGSSALRVVLLESPIFVIGKPPQQYCKSHAQSSVAGYFGRRGSQPPDAARGYSDCEAVLGACHQREGESAVVVSA